MTRRQARRFASAACVDTQFPQVVVRRTDGDHTTFEAFDNYREVIRRMGGVVMEVIEKAPGARDMVRVTNEYDLNAPFFVNDEEIEE